MSSFFSKEIEKGLEFFKSLGKPSSLSEENLIEWMCLKDEKKSKEAWDFIFREYGDEIYESIHYWALKEYKNKYNTEDIKDFFKQGFHNAIHYRKTFKGARRQDIRPWIYTIIMNVFHKDSQKAIHKKQVFYEEVELQNTQSQEGIDSYELLRMYIEVVIQETPKKLKVKKLEVYEIFRREFGNRLTLTETKKIIAEESNITLIRVNEYLKELESRIESEELKDMHETQVEQKKKKN